MSRRESVMGLIGRKNSDSVCGETCAETCCGAGDAGCAGGKDQKTLISLEMNDPCTQICVQTF